jgi:acyl-CoA synthetase (AMP-forming)/AMP-acid ligase II
MTGPPVPQVPFRPTIGAALHHAVAYWPDHDFIVTPDRHMTYAQAEEESRRLGRRMLSAGMGKGTRVGLYFPYGQEWVIAWLAASRIGAVVMPLATTYRPAEIRKVLRIGDIDTLLTARVVLGHDMQDMLEASVPGLADATDARLFLRETPSLRALWLAGDVDRAWATPLDFATDVDIDAAVTDDLLAAIEAEVVPADLAQVTYTSGSSADPKGVVHTRASSARSRSSGSAAR